MSTIVTRAGKGSPLTNTELDSNFTNLNTDKLELSGGTLTGNLSLGDNVKAQFGAGADLQIYHDGSNSYIADVGTGVLNISGSSQVNINASNGENAIQVIENAGVRLRHNNIVKLDTTSTGIDVTGSVVADGLTVDGDATISDTTPSLLLMESDTTDLNTRLLNNGGDFFLATINDSKSSVTNRLSLDHATGDISFYNDSAAQGLFFDASTSRLGLGVTNPNDPLHVQFSNNTGADTGIIIKNTNTGTTSNFAGVSTQAVNGSVLGTFSSADYDAWGVGTFVGSQSNHPTYLIANNAVKMTINADGSSVFSGAVSSTGATTVNTDSINIGFTAPNGEIKVKNSSGSPAANLDFYTTNTSGTTSLAQRITHDGKAEFSGAVTANAGVTSTGTGTFGVLTVDTMTLNASSITGSSNLTFDVAGDINLDAAGNDIKLKANGTTFGQLTNDSGQLIIYNAGSQMLKGNSGANALFQGNLNIPNGKLGIGFTTVPFAKAHIKDTAWSSGSPYGAVQLIEGNNVNDDNWGHLVITDTTTSNGNGGSIRFATGASSSLNPFAGVSGVSEGGSYGGLAFYTRPSGGTATERMKILSSGHTSFTLNTNAMGTFNDAIGEVGSGTFALQVSNSAGSALKPLGFRAEDIRFATGSSELMRLTSTGLGIGIQVPHRPLHINGTEGVARFTSTASGNSGLEVGVGTASQAFVWHTENAHMEFATNNIERMRIDSSGNVGIGTSSPNAYSGYTTLTLNNATNGGLIDLEANGTRVSTFFGTSSQTNFGTVTATPLVLLSNNTERARLTSGGDLLVGETADFNATSTTATGMALTQDGRFTISRSGTPMFVARLGSDGTLIDFWRQGAQVGSIASLSGDILIGTGNTGLRFYDAGKAIQPRNTDGSTARGSDAISLGMSDDPFKDLYLSGTANADKFALSSVIYIDSPTSSITRFDAGGGDHVFYSGSTNELFRATNGGDFLVGTTSSSGSIKLKVLGEASQYAGYFEYQSSGYGLGISNVGSSGSTTAIFFFNTNGAVGSISTSGSSTAYNTSSDERLKDNIKDADDSGSKIDAIQVRQFDWKADGEHQDFGMVAQELLEVAPDAVTKGDTPDDMMGVDYSKLVPMLIKEIQSLRQRVAQLEE